MGVIIGMDPHKSSATIEVVDEAGAVAGRGRFGTDRAGYAAMLVEGRRHGGRDSDRVWAVEGCRGIGQHIAHRLVRDGETVLDVPPRLSAEIRVFATGNGRLGRRRTPVRFAWASSLAPRGVRVVALVLRCDVRVTAAS